MIRVVRVYSELGASRSGCGNYCFSIVSDDSAARYVFGGGANWVGLDSSRIEMNRVRFEKLGLEVSSADDWLEVAAYRVKGVFKDVRANYKSIEGAVRGEREFASRERELS